MANITKCSKCGGQRFVPDIGESMPMKEHLKGTTFVNFGESKFCTCKK